MQCLDRNPSKRPTIEQIKAFEWFADMYAVVLASLYCS